MVIVMVMSIHMNHISLINLNNQFKNWLSKNLNKMLLES